MSIDCHYHLDTRIQSFDNLIQKMDANQIEKTALMPYLCDPLPHTPEFLLKLLRFFLTHRSLRGLAKKLAANFTAEGDIELPKGIVKIYADPDNAPVAQGIEMHPDRFLGWLFVNPRGEKNPLDVFDEYENKPGFIGVKAHPFWHRYPPAELMPVAEKAARKGMPLLIHVGFHEHGEFMPLVNTFPELKLILAHTGFPGYADTWSQIQDHPNVMVDVSADAYVDAITTHRAVTALGPERCLFGTDGPYGHTAEDQIFDNGRIKRRIEKLFPDSGVVRLLLGENFRALIAP